MKIAQHKIIARKTNISLRFEEQNLTSYAGVIVFQKFFEKINLKAKLKRCSRSLNGQSKHMYRFDSIFSILILNIILGFKRLGDSVFYKDDPMIQKALGLNVLPSVATISRMMNHLDDKTVKRYQDSMQQEVLECLKNENLKRITLDFDGSVLSSKRHAEGMAVGFNKKKKGERSYYPLFCMIEQLGLVLNVLHRSGNNHDSKGAIEFVLQCIKEVRQTLPQCIIEIRMDSAFFSDKMLEFLETQKVEYTISAPFERFTELKEKIVKRRWWHNFTGEDVSVGYFEKSWKPKSWAKRRRFIFARARVQKQRKKPLQLDLFEPIDREFKYKVIVSNKKSSSKSIVRLHEGRGQQEHIFAELKTQAAMDYIPVRSLFGNQAYLISSVFAHNLSRIMQIQNTQPQRGTNQKRSPNRVFEGLAAMRKKFINRAGRLTYPQGKQTLSLSDNPFVREYFTRFLPSEMFL